MRRAITAALLFLVTMTYCAVTVAETLEVRLRILQNGADEKVINRDNLLRIKQFMLQNGQRETYCNMYNANPAYHTKGFRFYLNPDSPQNTNCDPAKSDFNSLTIRSVAGGRNEYRTVDFVDQHSIYVIASWPTDDLTVSQIRQLPEDALRDLLAELDQKKPNKPTSGGHARGDSR